MPHAKDASLPLPALEAKQVIDLHVEDALVIQHRGVCARKDWGRGTTEAIWAACAEVCIQIYIVSGEADVKRRARMRQKGEQHITENIFVIRQARISAVWQSRQIFSDEVQRPCFVHLIIPSRNDLMLQHLSLDL